MADFKKAMDKLKKLEFNSPDNVLHHNKGERGYTYYGIYETAHPSWSGWQKVYKAILEFGALKTASRELYQDKELEDEVYSFYKKNFWDIAKLDFVKSQKIADEIFIFGVNTNPRKAIKKAQKIVGAGVDGWVGKETLHKLNSYDPAKFDIEFDLAEIAYYKYLAFFSKRKNIYKRFYNGWINRARAV